MTQESHTPINYANYAGVLMAKTQQENTDGILWIDCGENAATLQEALREGCTHLVFHGDAVTYTKLQEIAAKYGAILRRPSDS